MYKILIKSKDIIFNRQTPLRRIIHQQQTNQSINESSQISNINHFFINKIIGNTYLFKQIIMKPDLKPIEQQLIIKSHKIEIKSQIILLLNIQINQLDILLNQIVQRQQHIDFIDEIMSNDKQKISIVIYFKNIIVCQQIYHLISDNFQALPLYLKEVILVQDKQDNINGIKMTKIANRDQKIGKIGEEEKRWIQLPICLKCLEKLEYNVTGIPSTIFMKRISHSKSFCLTCKTIQRKRIQHQQTHCQDCKSFEDNWICLVCSKIGCGRYINGDAYKHFKEQNHILTMDLSTQRVWNYLSDCFSHRVIPLQKHQFTLKFPEFSQKNTEKQYQQSLQGAFWQYCSVVSEELQRQRIFYEKQMQQQDQKFIKQKSKIQTKILQLQKQIQQKQLSNKKNLKKYKKNSKKIQEIKQKCLLDRQILNNYQRIAKEENKQIISIQFIQNNSQKIKQKKRIINDLEQQISNVIVKLTE